MRARKDDEDEWYVCVCVFCICIVTQARKICQQKRAHSWMNSDPESITMMKVFRLDCIPLVE